MTSSNVGEKIPTLYEYYTSSVIKSGLSDEHPYFILNGRQIVLFSGALHYFRVVPEYWRDRLRKCRAAGLNAVETYIPWNLHEPLEGVYDFGKGGTDYEKFLDLRKFLQTAQEEDLLVIVRPGPYICAEWEFGGMPSWLLRDPAMRLRTSDEMFMRKFQGYFKELFKILTPLQFTKGGPIIAFQIENEYGNTKNSDENYLKAIKDAYLENGVVELLFTSDTPSNGFTGVLPGILATANFDASFDVQKELELLKVHQPKKPVMVMEYWSGWFDHWTEEHNTRSPEIVCGVYEDILKSGASINIYMFHGGSNWGFMNGGNFIDESCDNSGYTPTISSYDYDAPLTENGDYTEKYRTIRRIIKKHNDVKTFIPNMPEYIKPIAYPEMKIIDQLPLEELIRQLPDAIENRKLLSMEMLPVNDQNGQSYGYIIYRKTNITIPANANITIEGNICDTVMVLLNGQLVSKILETKDDLEQFGYWKLKNSTLKLNNEEQLDATIDLVVENWGRANFGKLKQFKQQKGIWRGNVLVNDEVVEDWKIYPLEFKTNWTNNLKHWSQFQSIAGPTLYRAKFNISELNDTFIDTRNWNKGIVIVNGFVLSRYLHLGPQKTIYLPGPLQKIGVNELLIFEHFIPSDTIKFTPHPIFHTVP